MLPQRKKRKAKPLNKTTDGLVIKEVNIGEADRMITVLTKDDGIISAYASGVKSIKSKRGGATGLLAYSNFSFTGKGDTYRVKEASPINLFFGKSSDIEILAIEQYFCELALAFGESASDGKEFLRLILNSLYFLTENKKNPYLIKAITEMRICTISGYCPDLVACNECGKYEDDIMHFNIVNGTLVCNGCGNSGININRTLLSALRHIVYSDFSGIYSFEIPENDAEILSEITEEYLNYRIDKKFKTLEFLKELKRGTY